MCGPVCFGLEVKIYFLGIKTAKLSMCTLCTLFLAQQNVRAGPKNLGDQTGLTFTRLHCCLLSLKKKECEKSSQNKGWLD